MLNVYADFAEDFMAMPVIKGKKSEGERFPGAVDTYCIEALMQDGKALQAGTSHFLGQNFAKAFDVKYASKEGKLDYVWGTSWGVSTRLMGALIMAHSDDEGLVLPPKLAPIHVVIVPIFRNEDELARITVEVDKIAANLRAQGHTVKFDNRDTQKPGFKFAEWELKGVPVRLAIGPRDLENGTVEVARRDTKEKQVMKLDRGGNGNTKAVSTHSGKHLSAGLTFRTEMISKVDTYEEFKRILDEKTGFILAHWDGYTGNRSGHQRGDKGDYPVYSAGCRGRSREMRLFRQAVHETSLVCDEPTKVVFKKITVLPFQC